MKRTPLVLLLLCVITSCTTGTSSLTATIPATEIPSPTVQPTATPLLIQESWATLDLVTPENPLQYTNPTSNYTGAPIYQSKLILDQDTRWQVDLESGKLVDDIGEASTGLLINGLNSRGEHPVLYLVYQMGSWNLGYAPVSSPDYTFGDSFPQLTDPAQRFEISITNQGRLLTITNQKGFHYAHSFLEPLFSRADYIQTETQVGPQSSMQINALTIEQKQAAMTVPFLPTPIPSADEYMYVFHVAPNGNDQNPGTAELPFATLDHARQIVSLVNQNMTGDILILLHGGVYPIGKTIRFRSNDSGSNGHQIIYRAADGEVPVLSGGISVTGWEPVPGSPMWRTVIPEDIGPFRQLYIDGIRAQRATSEAPLTGVRYAAGEFSDRDGIVVRNSAVPVMARPQDLELHWIYDWKDIRLPVQDAEINTDDSQTLWMAQPYYSYALAMGSEDHQWLPRYDYPFYIENALELIDQPGEWYFNSETKELFYLPRVGEDMPAAESMIPQTEQLIELSGGAIGQEVHDISFEGLTFAFAGWIRASKVGTFGWQAQNLIGKDWLEMTPAHIHLSSSRNISFHKNRFVHLGASALGLGNNTRNITIQGNLFFDISDAAIVIGHWDDAYIKALSIQSQPRNNIIANNLIDQTGVEYWGASGINAYYVENLQIVHNELSNLPYTGISLGWGWSSTTDSTTSSNNRVAQNLITDVILKARDAGAIYTLGQQPGTIIEGNVMRRLKGDYGCLYPDEGSAYITYRNNLCDTAPQYLYIWINSIHDLKIQNTYSNVTAKRNEGVNIQIENSVFVDDQNWPLEAQAIMDQAGLEPSFQYLHEWLQTAKRPQ